ncbi:MAG: PD-(D/E)XK nuclease family protein [Janthinobacterium lividum]
MAVHRDSLWTDLPRISPSSVGDLTSCPKRYAETRILKNWGSNNRDFPESVAHGTAVHSVLRDVFQDRQGPHVKLENVSALSRSAVYKGRYPSGFDRPRAIERVIETVCGYVRCQDGDDIEGTIRCEDQIEFPFSWEGRPLCMISATLDRLLTRPDQKTRLVIKEYKTTRPKIDLQEVFVAMFAARRAYPDYESYVMEIDWIADDGTVSTDSIEGRELRGLHPIIFAAAVKVIHEKKWDACPSGLCTFCHLRPECQQFAAVEMCEGDEVF